jgi:hypothetical protein
MSVSDLYDKQLLWIVVGTMKFSRIFSMANKDTFTIPPIKELINRYVGDGKRWIDPMAGNNSPAEFTNDINPNTSAKCHLHYSEFIKNIPDKLNGMLFDPPYSLRQLKECYESIDMKMTFDESHDAAFSKLKKEVAPKIRAGGYVISCGWSSMGCGKDLGFEIVEIRLVPHGGPHYDTIVMVEQKVQNQITANK